MRGWLVKVEEKVEQVRILGEKRREMLADTIFRFLNMEEIDIVLGRWRVMFGFFFWD